MTMFTPGQNPYNFVDENRRRDVVSINFVVSIKSQVKIPLNQNPSNFVIDLFRTKLDGFFLGAN